MNSRFIKPYEYESDLLAEIKSFSPSRELRDDLYGLPIQSDLSIAFDYENRIIDYNPKLYEFVLLGKTMFNCWSNEMKLPFYAYQRVDLVIKKPYVRPIEPPTEFIKLSFEGKTRGHLNPSSFCRDSEDIYSSFSKYNIVPQRKEINNGPCNKLEQRIMKYMRRNKCIGHVTTVYKVAECSTRADQLFKVIFYEKLNGPLELQCFLINDERRAVIREVHLIDVEKATGLKFLNAKTFEKMITKNKRKHVEPKIKDE